MEAETFWYKVKMRMSELNHNQEWLCSKTGLVLQSLRNKIHRNSMPSVDMTMKIIEVLGLNWSEFQQYPDVKASVANDVVNIPVYDQYFSAGHGQLLAEDNLIRDYVAVPKSLSHIGYEHLAATFVRGDSMEPTLFDGDTIICDNLGYDGTEGVYIIIYKGSGFVKRILLAGDEVNIISDNKMYPVMKESKYSEDFKIIGKVRYVMHKI